MIKKLTAALLSVCILTSIMVTGTVQAKTVLPDKAETLLTALDIVSEEDNLDAAATRGQFAEMAGKIVLKDNSGIGSYKSNFPDVGEYDEIYPYVSVLSEIGYVVGYSDGKFHPEDPITTYQAAKILLNVLGLAFTAEESDSYVEAAFRFGLFSKVQAGNSESLTVGAAAMLIYNALNADAVLLELLPNAKVTFRGIYMEEKLGIYETSGIITDDGKTALSGPTEVLDNEIVINGLTMINETGNSELLGRKVNAYYKYDEDEMTAVLFAACIISSEISIDAQNITNYEALSYSYLIDLYDYTEKKASLENGFAVIYNGISVYDAAAFDETKMQPQFGSITLINNDNDSKYECLLIEDYTPVSVIGTDAVNNKIYGSENEVIELEEESSTITDINGNKITVSEIKINSIASVYKSLDGAYTKVIVSAKTIEGTINSINEEYVRINGGDYRYLTEIKDSLTSGGEGVFYLDHRNIIIVFDKGLSLGTIYAYLYRVYIDEDDENLYFGAYTQENRLKIYRAAQTVTVDGQKYKKSNYKVLSAYFKDDNGDVKKQLVLLKLNSDGDVCGVDTAGRVESKDSLQIMPGADNEQLIFQVVAQTFAGKAMVDGETKVFLVPTEFDKSQLWVEDYKSLRNDSPYNVTAYTIKKDKLVADAVVITLDKTGIDVNHAYYSLEQLPFVVTDITQVLNNNDEVVYQLSMTNHAKSVVMLTSDLSVLSLTSNEQPVTVSVGDVVRYGCNRDGVIDSGNILLLYDEDRDYFENNGLHAGTYDSYRQALRAHMAYVDKAENNYIRFKYEKTADTADMDSYLLDTCKVFIYNRKRKILEQGTVNDLISGDKVVFYAASGRLNMTVIYR